MKNFISALTIILVIIACNNDDDKFKNYRIYDSGEEEFGHATGTANGLDWRSSAYYVKELSSDSTFAIGFETFEGGFYREVFSIARIKKGKADYPLRKGLFNSTDKDKEEHEAFAFCVILADDNHVIGQKYLLDEKAENWLEVLDWNEETGVIKGVFQMSFIRDEENISSSDIYAKRITIKDGYFECRESM